MTDMPSEAELQAREERVRANAAATPAPPCTCPEWEPYMGEAQPGPDDDCPWHGSRRTATRERIAAAIRQALDDFAAGRIKPLVDGWYLPDYYAAAVLPLLTAERERVILVEGERATAEGIIASLTDERDEALERANRLARAIEDALTELRAARDFIKDESGHAPTVAHLSTRIAALRALSRTATEGEK